MMRLSAALAAFCVSGIAAAGTITIEPGTSVVVSPGEATTVQCTGGGAVQDYCTCDAGDGNVVTLTFHRFVNGTDVPSLLGTYDFGQAQENKQYCINDAFLPSGSWNDACRLR